MLSQRCHRLTCIDNIVKQYSFIIASLPKAHKYNLNKYLFHVPTRPPPLTSALSLEFGLKARRIELLLILFITFLLLILLLIALLIYPVVAVVRMMVVVLLVVMLLFVAHHNAGPLQTVVEPPELLPENA